MSSTKLNKDQAFGIACEILGPIGRMISASKSGYVQLHPNGNPVFNANLVAEGIGKIWHGDLDLAIDDKRLQAVASQTGHKLYVLREMDARFMTEASPRIENAVAVFEKC